MHIIENAPINHPDVAFTNYEIATNKKLARRTVVIECIIVFCLYCFRETVQYATISSLAIIVVSITMAVAKINKQEVVDNGFQGN